MAGHDSSLCITQLLQFSPLLNDGYIDRGNDTGP